MQKLELRVSVDLIEFLRLLGIGFIVVVFVDWLSEMVEKFAHD